MWCRLKIHSKNNKLRKSISIIIWKTTLLVTFSADSEVDKITFKFICLYLKCANIQIAVIYGTAQNNVNKINSTMLNYIIPL